MRYLSAAELDAALPMAAAIEAMRETFADLDQAVLPERSFTPVPRPGHQIDAWLGAMPAGWQGHGFGAKIVSLIADNPAAGRPAIQGVAVLLDGETGTPVLLTDAARLTTRRTAAMAGLATEFLAPESAASMALIGTGALAIDMIAAVRAVRPIKQLRLYNRTRRRADELASSLDLDVFVADSAADAIAGAEVVTLCTTSRTAVAADAAFTGGIHVNAVGNYAPDGTEMDLATVARARIWVDTYEGAAGEAGELLLAAAAGLIPGGERALEGDLAALVREGRLARASDDELTLFKSVGTAIADVGAMVAARRAAESAGLGTELA